MGDTEHLAIVRLDANDAVCGLELSTEAHWNQNEDDWRFFLTKGIVFGARDRAGNLVATAALLPYTESDAWISMVLVTAGFQRRGLATRLVDTCLNTASKLGLTTWLAGGRHGLWPARIYANDPVAAAAARQRVSLER
jgi:GNAT superfamily N-acetyltransferase